LSSTSLLLLVSLLRAPCSLSSLPPVIATPSLSHHPHLLTEQGQHSLVALTSYNQYSHYSVVWPYPLLTGYAELQKDVEKDREKKRALD
jgi:hypothetical protein